MKALRAYPLILLVSLIMWGTGPVFAQLQFPGKPMGDFRRMKAADVIYTLPPVDPLLIESLVSSNRESVRKPLQFAVERPVQLCPESHGGWIEHEGYRIWRVHIVSPGAYSLGLVFNEYRVEKGVNIFIYDPDQHVVKGAFTAGNNKRSGVLPVGHVPGEELIVEMQVPDHMADYGIVNIESVSHAFLDIGQATGKKDCPPGEFGCSQACEIDINCSEGDQWQETKKSVVRIYTTRQYCSGVLLNNTAYDGTPYVLTAEHCINHPYYADRSVFVFNYESPSCFGGDGSTERSIAGCDTIAVGDSIDFSLVRLSVTPPYSFDAFYAGWDRSGFQTSGSATIHHPWGDVKKISFDHDIPSTPAHPGDVPYADLKDYHYFSFWWIRRWEVGSTEGGSSGSPLLNEGQRVIGTLSGGIAKCGDSIGYDAEKERVIYSTALNYNDYYTKLGVAWDYYGDAGPSLRRWLDPGNTGATTIGGYLPTGVDQAGHATGGGYMICPNPAIGVLHIFPLRAVNGDIHYMVYDLSGALVISGFLHGQAPMEVDVGPLAPGVYVISLAAGQTREFVKFIVAR
jgi:lysyl endopeptidase